MSWLQDVEGPHLESKKFEQLEALLERSKAYTQFLTEQARRCRARLGCCWSA